MYVISVLLFLLICPLISMEVESARSGHTASLLALTGRWFCFWAVGVRLLVAGVRQVLQPKFTAQEIFRLEGPSAFPLVREIGFGNLALGVVALCSVAQAEWTLPMAFAGGLYYGLAGLLHRSSAQKNRNEWIAMVSDLFIACVLLVFVARTLLERIASSR